MVGEDLTGRSLATANPLIQRTTTVYDAAGQTVATIDARQPGQSRLRPGRAGEVYLTNPNNQRTTFSHDAAGQLLYQADPLARRSSFVYDLAGRDVQHRSTHANSDFGL